LKDKVVEAFAVRVTVDALPVLEELEAVVDFWVLVALWDVVEL
jgi:hypothetical protein